MNGYERVKSALAGEKADYRPVMLHNFQHCIRESGISFGEFRACAKTAAECFIKNAEKYDLDGILIDFDTATLAGACGCEVVYPDDKAAVATKHVLNDIEDVSKLLPVALENSRAVEVWLETSRLIVDYFGKEKYIRCNCDQAPFSLASMLRGSQELMMDLVDEDYEEEIMQLLRYSNDVTKQFIRMAAQTGAHCVSNGDSVAGPAMISPEMYEKFAVPFEREVAQEAHANGVDYFLHICGDTTKILSAFPTLGVDAMELDYKTNPQTMHDILSKSVAVSGIFDPSGLFLLGNAGDVEREVGRLLTVYEDSYRLILCSGCALSPDTPEENVRAFVSAVRGK